MKITDNTRATDVKIKTLQIGECFKYEDDLFIKVKPTDGRYCVWDSDYNEPAEGCAAVCLNNNEITVFDDNEFIVPVDCSITVDFKKKNG